MFVLIGILILLIIVWFVKRKKKLSRNQDIFETELWQQLRIKAHRLADDYEEGERLGKDFVNACYAVHKMTRGPEAITRGNFPIRIRRLGYIEAINKKPFYHGNSLKGKID